MYDKTIANTIKQHKKPYPFTLDLVEFPEFLNLTVYEDEIAEFEDEQRAAIMAYLQKVRLAVMQLGVRCEIGGLPGSPPKLIARKV